MYYHTFITHCHDITNHPKQLHDHHTQMEVPILVQIGLHQILSWFPIQHFFVFKPEKPTLTQSRLPESPHYIDDAIGKIFDFILVPQFPTISTTKRMSSTMNWKPPILVGSAYIACSGGEGTLLYAQNLAFGCSLSLLHARWETHKWQKMHQLVAGKFWLYYCSSLSFFANIAWHFDMPHFIPSIWCILLHHHLVRCKV